MELAKAAASAQTGSPSTPAASGKGNRHPSGRGKAKDNKQWNNKDKANKDNNVDNNKDNNKDNSKDNDKDNNKDSEDDKEWNVLTKVAEDERVRLHSEAALPLENHLSALVRDEVTQLSVQLRYVTATRMTP
jgi:hypothetical protein